MLSIFWRPTNSWQEHSQKITKNEENTHSGRNYEIIQNNETGSLKHFISTNVRIWSFNMAYERNHFDWWIFFMNSRLKYPCTKTFVKYLNLRRIHSDWKLEDFEVRLFVVFSQSICTVSIGLRDSVRREVVCL